MGPIKDIGDMLVEEVLTDVATTYFSERKEIEDQVRLFGRYVNDLAQKELKITKLIAGLNYLLLKKAYVVDFFQNLGLTPDSFITVDRELYTDTLPGELPRAFTLKSKYAQLVLSAYTQLQKAISAYMEGEEDYNSFSEEKRRHKMEVNYNMVLHMAQLINEKINLLNEKKSPSSVLQFAKSLNTELSEKERVTGAMSSDYEKRLNKKMVINVIDMDKISITTYPRPPETREVRKKIISWCKKRVKSNKKEVLQTIAHLKQHILLKEG